MKSLSTVLPGIIADSKSGKLNTAEAMAAVDAAIYESEAGTYQERSSLRRDAHLLLTGIEMARQGDEASDPDAEMIAHLTASAETLEGR